MKFLPIIMTLLLAACNSKPDKSAYFEGYVDYKIDVVYAEPKSNGDLKENTMRCYYKGGSFIKKIFGSDSATTSAILYHAPSKRFITMDNSLPKHYFYNADDNTGNSSAFKITAEDLQTTLLDMECIGYRASYPMSGYKSFTVNMTYYHAKNLPFDYSSLERAANPVYKQLSKYHSLIPLFYTEYNAVGDSITYTATRVVPTSLSDTLFLVPADKPLIHF